MNEWNTLSLLKTRGIVFFGKLACEQSPKVGHRVRRKDSEAEQAELDVSLRPLRVPHWGASSATG